MAPATRHVLQPLAQAAQTAISRPKAREDWLKSMYKLLINNQLNQVLSRLKDLSLAPDVWKRIRHYLLSNRHRMQYKTYLEQGLCIGSGAMESANKAVVQSRLKRSGQRWSQAGAQRVLNLRTCRMSDRWHLLQEQIASGN